MDDEKIITKIVPEDKELNSQGKLVFKKGHKSTGKVGRPKGSLSKTKALVEQLIGVNGTKIAAKIVQKALNDNDKDQVACLKMLIDRLVPPQRSVDIRASQDTAIQILVEGVQQFSKVISQEASQEIEAEFEEVDEDE